MAQFVRKVGMILALAVLAYPILVILSRYGFGDHRVGAIFQRNIEYHPHSESFAYTRLREAAGAGPVDLLLLGSSHAYRGLDPRIFAAAGVSSFNLGSSSQTPVQTDYLLERYLDQLAPGLVVYDVMPVGLSGDGAEGAARLIAAELPGADPWPLLRQTPRLVVLNGIILHYFDRARGRDPGPEPAAREIDTYVGGGYVVRDTTYREGKGPPPATPFTPRPVQLAALERSLGRLRAAGVKVLLVQSPITAAHRAAPAERAAFDRLMAGYGDYIDFNGRLPLVDSLHFYDYQHLRQRGVEIYNRALIDSLRARGYVD